MLNTKRSSYLILLFLAAAILLTANTAAAVTLTVTKIGTGNGTILSNPAGAIDCGATCSAVYTGGEFVTLEYYPDFVSEFVTWGGDASSCGTNWQCSFVISVDMTVTAEFSRTAAASLPLLETFATNAVPLNWKSRDNNDPSPSSNNRWDFFDECGRTNLTGGGSYFGIADSSCWGVMDTELITPEFTTAGINKVGLLFKTDLNSSASTTADIDVSVNQGATWTTVWTKAGVSLRGPAQVTLDISSVAADQTSVIARFHYRDDNSTGGGWWEVDDVKIVEHPALTVAKSGTGAGSVVSAVAGITCDPANTDCSEIYTPDSVVTLRAVPEAGSYFAGWSGGCVSSSLTCMVAMDAAKTVTADFTTTPPLVTTWINTYAGTDWDSALAGQQTMDGGYLVSGLSYSSATWGSIAVLKTDASGTVVWQQFIDGTPGPAMEILSSLQQTADGGYIATSLSPGLSLIKLDASGGITWQKFYSGSIQTSIYSVQQTADGGYIMTGYDYSGPSVQDILVVKTDSYGNLEWRKTFGGAGYNQGNSIRQTLDGGYILTGYMVTDTSLNDIIVIKLDASGNVAWQKTYGDAGDDTGYFILQTDEGGYVLAGQIYSTVTGRYNMAILRLDGTGALQWRTVLDYPGFNSYGYSLDRMTDGGYVISGGADDPLGSPSQALLVKLDGSGSPVWKKGWPKASANAVQQTADGGFFVAGNSYIDANQHMLAIKTDANGDTPSCLAGYNAQLTEVVQTVQETSAAYSAAEPVLASASYNFTAVPGAMAESNACFTAGNTPPSAPVLSSPIDASAVSTWGLSLVWFASTDPDAWDSVTYDVYVDQSYPPVTLAASNVGNTSISPTLQKNATYYWKIDAKDTHGGLASSPTWSFTTLANQAPLVSAQTSTTYADTCYKPYYIYFNTTDPDGTIVKYEWDLNGDSIYDVTATTPDLIFNTPGTYTLTLRVTDNDGDTTDATMNPAYPVVVTSALQAKFTLDHILGQAGKLAVKFTDRTNMSLSCAGGTPTYLWDFGDGGTSTQQNPSYTYATAGTYDVTLTVTESTGNQAPSTITAAVEVFSAPSTTAIYVDVNNPQSTPDGTIGNPFTTIQAAIDLAAAIGGPGISILVSQGTYTENLSIYNTPRAIALDGGWAAGFSGYAGGSQNPALTIIDGGGLGAPAALVQHYINDKMRTDIKGFTLTNGTGYTPDAMHYEGGGIYAESTQGLLEMNVHNSIITNNTLTEASSSGKGAGIAITGEVGPVNIGQNTISSNGFAGINSPEAGGIYIRGSINGRTVVDLSDNVITGNEYHALSVDALWYPFWLQSTNNQYTSNGLGLRLNEVEGFVSSLDVIQNNASTAVDMHNYSSAGVQAVFDHATITGNGGDGLYLDVGYLSGLRANISMTDSAINNNTGHGLYIYNYGSEVKAKIERTRLNVNAGSGFYMDLINSEIDPVIDLNMVNSVAANNGGSGVDLATGSASTQSFVKIVNSTLTGNAVKGVNASGDTNPPFDISVLNSIVWGNVGRDLYTSVGNVSASYSDIGTRTTTLDSVYTDQGGNISADPLLTADYHLTLLSPALNAGTNTGAPATDIDGDTRPVGLYADMGADESLTLPDSVPDPFAFADANGVSRSTIATSNTITVAGINIAAAISITGGQYSINGGSYTSAAGTVGNGDTVTLQVTSSSSYSTTVNATLIIGGVSGTFSVTTIAAPDTMPPTVVSTAPTDGATDVPAGSAVTVTFSEDMLASSITSTTFLVSGMTGSVTYAAGTMTATFTPSSALASFTTYTATVTTGAKDLAGNALAVNYDWSFTTADLVPPVGTVTINGGAPFANSASAGLTLTCTDAGSGCSQMEFSNDGGTWSGLASYATSTGWTLSGGDGIKTVYARFTDAAGNLSASTSGSIQLDTLPPVTTATPAGGSFVSGPTVTLTANEPATIRYTVDGTDPIVSSPTYTAPILVSAGTTTLKYFAVDLAGNAEAVQTQVYVIDANMPQITNVAPASGSFVNSSTVSYTLNKLMASGSVVFTRVSGTADSNSPHTYPMTQLSAGSHLVNDPVTLVDGAVYTIEFSATDGVTSAPTVTVTNVTFDQAAAGVTITSPTPGGRVNTPTVSYLLSEPTASGQIVIDDGSASFVHILSGAELTAGAHTVTTSAALVNGMTYTFSIANVVDLAGNPSPAAIVPNVIFDTMSVVISNTGPETKSIITSPTVTYTLSEQAATGAVTFTWTGGNPDPASPHVITLAGGQLNAGTQTVTPSITLADGAFYTVSFSATDLVGNPAVTVSNALVFFDSQYGIGPVGNVDNTDGLSTVNNADVIKLQGAMGTQPGDGRWNPVCDLDRNNVVDVSDLLILHSHYGQTGP